MSEPGEEERLAELARADAAAVLDDDLDDEPAGDDGLTGAEREQLAEEWRQGAGSKSLAAGCVFCGAPMPCASHRAGG